VTVAGIVKAAPFAKTKGVRVLPCATVAGIVKAAAFAKTAGVKVIVTGAAIVRVTQFAKTKGVRALPIVKEARSANAPVATAPNSAKRAHRYGAEKACAARPVAGEPRAAVVVPSKAAVR